MKIMIMKGGHVFVIQSEKDNLEEGVDDIIKAITVFASDRKMPYFDYFDAAVVCDALSEICDKDI
tara:strand:- start:489 stop:683 length:195 start_codon:yes stop_codon:yes gene_type:complete